MNVDDIESLVVQRYHRHNLDPSDPVTPWQLARLELGPRAFDNCAHLIGGSHAYELRGRWRIAISKRLSPAYAAHAVGHELGHAIFAIDGIRFESKALEEEAADLFGGAVLAPAPAVRAFHRAHGLKLRALARQAVSTPTWAALRVGEALGIPCAVISPERVRVRGPDAFSWPAAEQLRTLAKTSRHGTRTSLGKDGRVAFFPRVDEETAA